MSSLWSGVAITVPTTELFGELTSTGQLYGLVEHDCQQ